MPLYEYECKKCHHRFERIVKYSDRPMKKCPDCGGPVEQTITAPAVQFKGSGWYVTDYAKKSTAPASSSNSNGDSKSKDEAASKKESASKEDLTSKKEEKSSKSTEKSKSETSSKKAEKK
jgi:putative FmdB family regulatory protein